MSAPAIDSTAIWLAKSLLPTSAHEADRLAIAQIEIDNAQRSLNEILEAVQGERREEPGQFGAVLAGVQTLR